MAFTTPIKQLIDRNANGLLGKHPSWGRVRLGDVATVQNGAAFKSEYFNTDGRGMPLLRIRDVIRGATETWYDGPFEEEYIVEPGELVIGMDGDFNHALWAGPPALLNQRVCRLVFHADVLRKAFVLYALGGYLAAVNEATPSVTVKHLSSKTVADLLLPLPSVAEQDELSGLLDAHLTRIEDGFGCFSRALSGVTKFKASVLAEAFVDAPATVPLERVAIVQSGIAKGRAGAQSTIDLPYLRTANVQAGYLDLTEIKSLRVTEEQRARHRLRTDDVLVLEGGDADKVGRGWLWEGQVSECLHQNHVFAVRTDTAELLPRYLAYYINSPSARRYFLGAAKQTTNLASINKRQLKALPVPLPTVAAQRRAVAFIERHVAAADACRRSLEQRLAEASTLRHAILAAAMVGELGESSSAMWRRREMLARDASQENGRDAPHDAMPTNSAVDLIGTAS